MRTVNFLPSTVTFTGCYMQTYPFQFQQQQMMTMTTKEGVKQQQEQQQQQQQQQQTTSNNNQPHTARGVRVTRPSPEARCPLCFFLAGLLSLRLSVRYYGSTVGGTRRTLGVPVPGTRVGIFLFNEWWLLLRGWEEVLFLEIPKRGKSYFGEHGLGTGREGASMCMWGCVSLR